MLIGHTKLNIIKVNQFMEIQMDGIRSIIWEMYKQH